MMSRDQWNETAEKSAAEAWGREHRGWFAFKQFAPLAGFLVALATIIGLAVWLIRKAAHAVGEVHVSAPGSGVPLWVWLAMAVAGVASFLILRPRWKPASPGVLVVKIAIVAFLWLALIGLAFGYGVG